MSTTPADGRLTSLAPQFLVDDLERAIAFDRKIGFAFGEPWDGFEQHLEEAPSPKRSEAGDAPTSTGTPAWPGSKRRRLASLCA